MLKFAQFEVNNLIKLSDENTVLNYRKFTLEK